MQKPLTAPETNKPEVVINLEEEPKSEDKQPTPLAKQQTPPAAADPKGKTIAASAVETTEKPPPPKTVDPTKPGPSTAPVVETDSDSIFEEDQEEKEGLERFAVADY